MNLLIVLMAWLNVKDRPSNKNNTLILLRLARKEWITGSPGGRVDWTILSLNFARAKKTCPWRTFSQARNAFKSKTNAIMRHDAQTIGESANALEKDWSKISSDVCTGLRVELLYKTALRFELQGHQSYLIEKRSESSSAVKTSSQLSRVNLYTAFSIQDNFTF